MSSTQPPGPPPSGPPSSGPPPSGPPPSGPPPSGPPGFGPPSGPPPVGPPSGHGGTEVLEQGRGGPLPPAPPRTSSGRGRRRFWWIGGGVAAAALLGAGAVGAWWYTATGPQPAEALPASTIGYLAVDLDPSGGQKLDALRTLKKFPLLAEELGLDGDLGEIDLAEKAFDLIQDESGCEGLDYADDIEPWLGSRMAVGAVDHGGDEPAPVFVVQVTDGDAAEKGIATLDECGGSSEPSGAVVDGDWMIVAETQEIADDVAKETAEASLADDDSFQRWTDAAGDPGILALYAGPGSGEFFAEDLFGDDELGLGEDAFPGVVPHELTEALEDFGGMAMTVRFDDGALEVEVASDAEVSGVPATGSDRGGEAVSSLPADTLAALGLGLEEGWLDGFMESITKNLGEDGDSMIAEAEEATGLEFPEDIETLLGDSAALALGPDLDLEKANDGDLPFALKVLGDADAIEEIAEQLREASGAPDGVLEPASEDGAVVAALDDDYRDEVLADGDLGDSAKFKDVVPEAGKASMVLYVDLDGVLKIGLDDLGEDEDEVRENLEPLAAVGLSSWIEDDTSHQLFRITTD